MGSIITQLRKKKGVSKKIMAASVGISAAYLGMIESDRAQLTVQMLPKVATYLGTTAPSMVMAVVYGRVPAVYNGQTKTLVDNMVDYLCSYTDEE